MKTKCLPAILVTGAMSLGTAPAIAESSNAPELNFSCQVVDGVPTTLAQPKGSEATIPVFHWKQEALAPHSYDTPQQLCDRATAKLEDYSAQGYDLSEISFIGAEPNDLPNIPSICASTNGGDCSKVLLTLSSSDRADVVAKDVVDAIIAKDLKQFKQEGFNDRGLQSTSYQVNFWSLFGLKFLGK